MTSPKFESASLLPDPFLKMHMEPGAAELLPKLIFFIQNLSKKYSHRPPVSSASRKNPSNSYSETCPFCDPDNGCVGTFCFSVGQLHGGVFHGSSQSTPKHGIVK